MDRMIKNLFRKSVRCMPTIIKKKLTGKKVDNILSQLMPEKDVKMCYKEPELIDVTLHECEKKDPQKAVAIKQEIEKVISSSLILQGLNEKEKKLISKDMLFCHYAYGFKIIEYVMFKLWDKNIDHASRNIFISDSELYAFRFCANDFTQTVYADKVSVYNHLKKYFKREMVAVGGEKDREKFIKFALQNSAFVRKPLNLAHGDGVSLVKLKDNTRECCTAYFEKIHGKVLFEEVIEQHEKMEVFNSDSLNTIRVYTLYTRDGIVVISSIIRTGRRGSFVDNVSSGGVSARIDIDSGIVVTDAVDKYGNRYTAHPDTNIRFQGFDIPNWTQLIDICKDIAMQTPDLKFLGLDMALSKDSGWVVVEVNTSPGMMAVQAADFAGLKPVLIKYATSMDLMVPFSFRK